MRATEQKNGREFVLREGLRGASATDGGRGARRRWTDVGNIGGWRIDAEPCARNLYRASRVNQAGAIGHSLFLR